MTNNQYETMLSIYPNFTDCSIQTFDDAKKWRDLARIVDQNKFDTETMSKALEKYNSMWAWIFFSVNSMEWWKRNKDSVTHINSWICECDDKTKEEQMEMINNCPLKPSLIIESNKSYHMYWFADNWKIENWNKICRWLCNYFWWDTQVVDISRVLRVPWFNHMKNPDSPFMCEIKWWEWTYYTEEQMLTAYPDTTSAQEKKEEERRLQEHKRMMEKYKQESDWAWYNINALDAMNMLEEISWHRMVSWEQFSFRRNWWIYQIVVNWRDSWAWIDRNWLIWSNSKWWPTWVNWVKWYWIYDDKEIYQYIKDNHPECIPEKKQPIKLQNYKEALVENDTEWEEDDLFTDYEFKEVDFSSVVPFTWGIEELNNKFWRIDYWKFIAAVWESWAWKTTYTFFQATQNANMWHKVCYVSLEQDPWELLLLKALKRYWISKWDWDNKTITEQQKQNINNMIREYGCNKNMRITKVNNPTLERLCKAIIKAKSEWYMLFYIDNLWIILSDKWSSKEYDMVTECSRVFMTLAHEEWVTIILLHHFNQWNSVSRFAPRTLADIRWWAKLEHDCDLVFQVRRNLDYEDTTKKNTTQIIVQKNRQWGTEWSMEIKFIKWWYEPITNDDELESPI